MSSLLDDVRTVSRGWRWTRRPLVPRSAEPWTPPKGPREFPTEWARTPAARTAREGIQRYLLRPLVWTETSPSVHGLDRLGDLPGPVLFASNHASHLDAPLVLCSLPRRWRERTAVGAAADYFFDVWWRAMATALAFNAFPIERARGGRVHDTATRLIRDGWSLLVFPEGTRSPDGWLQRFHSGSGRLCVELGVPAVPIAIRGAYAAMPRGRGWPRPGRPPISVRYGSPVWPEDGERPREFTARLASEVGRLWDEDRTTWWESRRSASLGDAPTATGPSAPRWRRVWEASRPLGRPGRPRVWG